MLSPPVATFYSGDNGGLLNRRSQLVSFCVVQPDIQADCSCADGIPPEHQGGTIDDRFYTVSLQEYAW